MVARLIALLVLLFCAGGAVAETRVTLADGRSYLIAVPEGVKQPPLVVMLHGGGGNGAQSARSSGMTAPALRRGFAIAYPDGSGRSRMKTWNAGHCCARAALTRMDDVAFVLRVADDAARRFGTDRSNLFVAGMSNGGMLAERIAAERPREVRAVASVAGVLDLARIKPRGAVPVLHMHGTEDEMVPYAGGRGALGLTYAAAEDVLTAFLQAQRRGLTKTRKVIDQARDGMQTEKFTYASSSGRPEVVFYRIVGGGHAWPGGSRGRSTTRDINAPHEIFAFFKAHLRK
ncbi:alpha/beta hydrolase family esterase [Algicella marina]|nr:PHB depolymerase family esterase [Algicella marina]